jgi:hypothetical protein
MTELPQATTDQLYFRDPDIEPPPKATSMLLLNAGGVCIIGVWDNSCIAWCPKPKIPQALKDKISKQSLWRKRQNAEKETES